MSGPLDFDASVLNAAMFRIAEITLAADAATIDIPNIPATYAHLLVMGTLRSTRVGQTTDSVLVGVNGDTTNANFDQRNVANAVIGENLGSGGGVGARALGTCPAANSPAATFGSLRVTIPSYSSATKRKLIQCEARAWRDRNTGGTTLTDAMIGWANTAAVSQLTFLLANGPNFLAGSSISVYGLRSAAF